MGVSVNIDLSETIMARGQGKRVTCYFHRKPIPDPGETQQHQEGRGWPVLPLREEPRGP